MGVGGLAPPKPPPSGAITPLQASIESSKGTPMAMTTKRRVIWVSDTWHATYRTKLYLLCWVSCLIICGLDSFIPLTPLECWTSQDLKDPKDNMSVAGSDTLADFDPSKLTFAQSQHNVNTSTSSTSLMLSKVSVTSSIPPNTNALAAGIQRRDYTAHCSAEIPGVQPDAFSTITIRICTCTLSSPWHLPGPWQGRSIFLQT